VTSDRQIEANRRNAKKSTGPRTAEGKAVVAQNAVRHGLLSTKLLIEGEEAAELFGLADRPRAELRPEGEDSEMIMVSAAHKFASYARETMTKVSRYEAQHERSLHASLRELQRLQAARADEAASTPPLLDGEAEPVEPGEAM
jgi:hypothetical protein